MKRRRGGVRGLESTMSRVGVERGKQILRLIILGGGEKEGLKI